MLFSSVQNLPKTKSAKHHFNTINCTSVIKNQPFSCQVWLNGHKIMASEVLTRYNQDYRSIRTGSGSIIKMGHQSGLLSICALAFSSATLAPDIQPSLVLPIAELAHIAELARASSDTELVHKIAKLAQASSDLQTRVAGLQPQISIIIWAFGSIFLQVHNNSGAKQILVFARFCMEVAKTIFCTKHQRVSAKYTCGGHSFQQFCQGVFYNESFDSSVCNRIIHFSIRKGIKTREKQPIFTLLIKSRLPPQCTWDSKGLDNKCQK